MFRVDESVEDELLDALLPIHYQMRQVADEGITITDTATGNETHVQLNLRNNNEDKKMTDTLSRHNTSPSLGCGFCNTHRNKYWETAGTNETYNAADIPKLRELHRNVILSGGTGAEANVAGAGHDGIRSLTEVVHRNLSIGLVHLIISIGNMFFKMFLLTKYDGPLRMTHSIWRQRAKDLRTKFTIHFNTPINVQMTANVGKLCSDLKHHLSLLENFVAAPQRPAVKNILELWASIHKVLWQKVVTTEEADALQTTLTGPNGFGTLLHSTFPSLPCPDYMHMLMDHIVPYLKLTGGIANYSEQPSESVHKEIHKLLMGYSRQANTTDAYSDVLLRLMYRHHPLVRASKKRRQQQREDRHNKTLFQGDEMKETKT